MGGRGLAEALLRGHQVLDSNSNSNRNRNRNRNRKREIIIVIIITINVTIMGISGPWCVSLLLLLWVLLICIVLDAVLVLTDVVPGVLGAIVDQVLLLWYYYCYHYYYYYYYCYCYCYCYYYYYYYYHYYYYYYYYYHILHIRVTSPEAGPAATGAARADPGRSGPREPVGAAGSGFPLQAARRCTWITYFLPLLGPCGVLRTFKASAEC